MEKVSAMIPGKEANAQPGRVGQRTAGAQSKWPLPPGVVDLFFEDAAAKRILEEDLRRLFAGWSYSEIIPPSFEYADTLASEAGTQLAEEMYRFVDRDGRTLALRPDLTIPTARVVGTRLYDQPRPLRLFYVGSVFRYEPPQAGRQREFTQAGIELVGAATPEADAEVLALTLEALGVSGVVGYQISLGQMGFFRGLLAELDAPSHAVTALQQAIDRKSPADLEAILASLDIIPSVAAVVRALPTLQGDGGVLAEARAFCLNSQMEAAVDRLQAIQELLFSYDLSATVSFDLGETRGMEYYTGITFKGYVPGLGFSVCSGGRYDDLVGHFGPSQAAVGSALWLDRLLLARQRQGRSAKPVVPGLLLAPCGASDCLSLVLSLRRRGSRVEVDVLNRSDEELVAYARRRGIDLVVRCAGRRRAQVLGDLAQREVAFDELERMVTGK